MTTDSKEGVVNEDDDIIILAGEKHLHGATKKAATSFSFPVFFTLWLYFTYSAKVLSSFLLAL